MLLACPEFYQSFPCSPHTGPYAICRVCVIFGSAPPPVLRSSRRSPHHCEVAKGGKRGPRALLRGWRRPCAKFRVEGRQPLRMRVSGSSWLVLRMGALQGVVTPGGCKKGESMDPAFLLRGWRRPCAKLHVDRRPLSSLANKTSCPHPE